MATEHAVEQKAEEGMSRAARHTHDRACNDYTGCNDNCGPVPATNATWRAGAWRRTLRYSVNISITVERGPNG